MSEKKATRKRGGKKAAADPVTAEQADSGVADGYRQLVQSVAMIPVNAIRPCAYNRALSDDDPRLESLADSIDQYGMTSPVTVRPLGPDEGVPPVYEIIDGERRWRACRKLGIVLLSAIVFDVDERVAHALRLVANRERQDLTFIEEGEGVAALMELHGDDVSEVAARVGRHEGWVRRRMRLATLTDGWRKELAREDSNYAHIRDSVERMEEVALLPHAEQDACLEAGTFRWKHTVKDMRQAIGERLHRIEARPWPEECEAELAEPACEACLKRSDRQGDLFAFLEDGGKKAKKGAACLDSACWNRKIVAWLLERLAEADAEASRRGINRPAVFVTENWCLAGHGSALAAAAGETLLKNRCFEEADTLDPDVSADYDLPVVAVIASGPRMGEIAVVCIEREWSDDDEDGEGNGWTPPDPADVERLRLERQAKESKRAAFRKALEKQLFGKCRLDEEKFLRLVIWYGYRSNEEYNMNRSPIPPSEKNPRVRIWTSVKKGLFGLLKYKDLSDEEQARLCEFFELDRDKVKEAMADALADALAAEAGKAAEREDGDA